MITTTDATNIMVAYLMNNQELPVYQKGNIPLGIVTDPRVTVIPQRDATETFWNKLTIQVNLSVPDIEESYEADTRELQRLERLAYSLFDGKHVGEYDGTIYRFSRSSSGTEEDGGLKCHYVNVQVLFEILNVR